MKDTAKVLSTGSGRVSPAPKRGAGTAGQVAVAMNGIGVSRAVVSASGAAAAATTLICVSEPA